ncbi:helicase RepA family protein [Streptomyces glaucescens]|uniref:helicase RepA family protein n=1 Tax=Streptomyces glaucescens TaxID=1907 RepID=UPI00344BF857
MTYQNVARLPTQPPPEDMWEGELDEQGQVEKISANPTQARLAELKAALVTSTGLDDIPEPVPIVDGVLYKDSLAWLYGKPGSGKSFVALDWAGCVANGMHWQHREVTRGPVLYLVAEGVSGIKRRVRAWEAAFNQSMDNVTFLPLAVQLLNGVDLSALLLLVEEMKPSLVVVDTQARVTVGADENSNGEMGRVVAAADKIREACKGCVLMVHHSGKNGLDLRGASAFEGAATSIIKVTKDGEYVEVHSDKQKDVEDFDTIFLRMVPEGDSVVLLARSSSPDTEEASGNEQKILHAMRESFAATAASAAQLIEVSGVPKASAYRALTALTNRALLVNVGTVKAARYALPETASKMNAA